MFIKQPYENDFRIETENEFEQLVFQKFYSVQIEGRKVIIQSIVQMIDGGILVTLKTSPK